MLMCLEKSDFNDIWVNNNKGGYQDLIDCKESSKINWL